MSSVVNGKRILFIGPVFYHYHTAIINEFKAKGADVVFFPESKKDLGFGISRRMGRRYFEARQETYYFSILEKIRTEEFDFFFLIKGESLPVSFVEVLKSKNPKILCIQYQWDSAKRNKFLHLINSFDKTITFDSEDARVYNITYQPLFYTEEIARIASAQGSPVYDLLVLGTYLPERERALRKLIVFCQANKISLKYHLFLNKVHYYTRLLKGKKINRDISSFVSLPYKEVVKLYAQSKVIVDFSNVHQSGLSMRVIEALGAGKKLITTNQAIRQESFYDPSFICVVDIHNPLISKEFIDNDILVDRSEIQNLHLSKWLERLFV